MNAVWFSLFFAVCVTIYFLKRNPTSFSLIDSHEEKAPTCESILSIQHILDDYKLSKKYETLIHSMTLMMYQSRMKGDTTLIDIIPQNHEDIQEIGKEVIEKYNIEHATDVLYHFLAGIIETEMENVRLDDTISYQDKQTIRKLIDVFYYKEI
ncbi:hypothetical protein PBCVNY2B_590R [Paramecium bursaria Chlorella virus NY2B]|uniref:Uncharacterized protein n=1 Tax=Paramecium bursaria Chlorella virus NYs1 TaxID=83442 RepID=M1I938_9PHYC|nr:hypothetical protein AR158_C523R [Paramecium bursaria Chlorella virus AR158]YP_009665446.1 hypothetical protein FK949_gp324 [Paramecium bursaria Chlorella virus NYs1]AGE54986.1 hypothetical protein PBCVMA1D_601R [Paramecium bursaria Chlorella virus MA1D]AGE58417.1 hypothetical protein PBCVNY2B_590R [Paramecium bursaria Chlorella virus NY2B]ABU44068.1 hypothetical protein AR158_C523R [Paramecium bursaria Chlorella virus AR158]AGE58801.1 hypothetical protein PBCVNYs1_604R [Paramecium bursaria